MNLNKNSFVKSLIKCFLILFSSIILGFLLLLGVYSLPTNKIFDNALKSREVFDSQEIRTWTGNPRYAKIDNATDRLMISEALARPYDSNIDNALLNPHHAESEEKHGLLLALDDDVVSYENYGRYWHGYLIYIIPGLLFFSVGELRIIFMIVESILAIMLIIELVKYKKAYAYIFGVIALLINPITAALSFQIADIYIIMMIFSIIILKFNDWLIKENRYIYLFLLNSICVAYFDYLTYPLVAWGIPMVLVIVVNEFSLQDSFKMIVLCSTAWCFGYAGMWAGKWILATLLTDVNVIEDGVNKFFLDSLNSNTTNYDLSYSNTLFRVRETFDTPMTALLLLGLVIILLLIIIEKRKLSIGIIYLKGIMPLLLIGLAPFVWYYVIRYHSCSHMYMEYRQIVITIFVVYLCIDKAFQ